MEKSYREVAAHVAAIEKTIVRLAARRAAIDLELQQLVAMMAIAEPTKRVDRAPAKTGRKRGGSQAVAQKLLEKGELTPAVLARWTGQSSKNAAQTLGDLARRKLARRVRKGVYVKVVKS